MTEAPAPMTPPDCDLRDYPWMPIDCTRLLTSETWLLGTSDQKVAAITLWMKSWHQVPAGSLPAHDKMLAALSEAGAAWNKVKQHVMRGWVLCSDGRLYHPVVCEKARESWERKLAQRARTEKARQAKAAKLSGASTDTPPQAVTSPVTEVATEDVTESVAETVTASNRPDQTRTDLRKKGSVLRTGEPACADPPAEPEMTDLRKAVWTTGLQRLAAITGLSPGRSRQRLGQLLRDCGDDCAGLMGALADCPKTPEANAWLTKAAQGIRNRASNAHDPTQKMRRDWHLTSFADPELLADLEAADTDRRLLQ